MFCHSHNFLGSNNGLAVQVDDFHEVIILFIGQIALQIFEKIYFISHVGWQGRSSRDLLWLDGDWSNILFTSLIASLGDLWLLFHGQFTVNLVLGGSCIIFFVTLGENITTISAIVLGGIILSCADTILLFELLHEQSKQFWLIFE